MTNEVKQRRKKQNDELSDTSAVNHAANGKNDAQRTQRAAGKSASCRDLKTFVCLACLAACGLLTWVVLQRNERFSELEEKLKVFHEKTAALTSMEEEVLRVSKQLAASRDAAHQTRSLVSAATGLERDVSALRAVVEAARADDEAASRRLGEVNARFVSVTETWQGRLATAAADLGALRAESRRAHAGASERVNEAERRARALEERLDELEDSTARNVRALERTEEEDARRAEQQLERHAQQLAALTEELRLLARGGAGLRARLEEAGPRARECERRLPEVEEAVRSVLRLGAALGGAEQRLQEAELGVFGAEENQLRLLRLLTELGQGPQAHSAPRRAEPGGDALWEEGAWPRYGQDGQSERLGDDDVTE